MRKSDRSSGSSLGGPLYSRPNFSWNSRTSSKKLWVIRYTPVEDTLEHIANTDHAVAYAVIDMCIMCCPTPIVRQDYLIVLFDQCHLLIRVVISADVRVYLEP